MDVSWVTDQGSPDRLNEDFVAAAPGAVVVLDGCGLPLGTDLGCAHGTAWYARSLGIERTRKLERTDPYCEHWPRIKPQDDATVAVCRFTIADS